MTIIGIGAESLAGEALAEAVAKLATSEPIIIPTDTVYGLAVKASDAVGREQIFTLKQRPASQTLAILVADVDQASTLVQVDETFEKLAEAFWPGALTLVAPPVAGTDPSLGADDGWIGVRAPKQAWVRRLAAEVGPIAATSANIHGQATPSDCAELAVTFPSTTVFDDGPGGTVASTVIRLGSPETEAGLPTFTMLREGHITAADLTVAVQN